MCLGLGLLNNKNKTRLRQEARSRAGRRLRRQPLLFTLLHPPCVSCISSVRSRVPDLSTIDDVTTIFLRMYALSWIANPPATSPTQASEHADVGGARSVAWLAFCLPLLTSSSSSVFLSSPSMTSPLATALHPCALASRLPGCCCKW